MSMLKRKDAPGGERPAKSAKKSKENRSAVADAPSKDAKRSTKPTSTNAGQSKSSVVSVLKDEEPMFPRGGGHILTPLEQKQIHLDAKADAMREDEFDTGKKAAKKTRTKPAAKGEKAAGAKRDEDNVKVDSLSFKVQYTIPYAIPPHPTSNVTPEIGQGIFGPWADLAHQQS